jgi:hypothetical protein
MNHTVNRLRLREVIGACHGLETPRLLAPTNWTEWGYCPDCAVTAGQPCYDVFGTISRPQFAPRSGPHWARRTAPNGGGSDV